MSHRQHLQLSAWRRSSFNSLHLRACIEATHDSDCSNMALGLETLRSPNLLLLRCAIKTHPSGLFRGCAACSLASSLSSVHVCETWWKGGVPLADLQNCPCNLLKPLLACQSEVLQRQLQLGCGSHWSHQGTAVFSLWFHLPRYLFWTHSHLTTLAVGRKAIKRAHTSSARESWSAQD